MKKAIFLLAVVFAWALGAEAQKSFELPLWEGKQVKDDRADARLFVYLSDNPNGQSLIICPGGGYAGLCMDYEGWDFAPWLNKYGINVFVLKYRMPHGRSTVPLSDAQQALRLVRSKAKEWHVDVNNVGIMGSSAGGHLAATAATHWNSKETRPDFQVLLYPVVSMDPSFTHMGTRQNLIGENPTDEQVALYSNELQVTDDTPPAFIVLSANDELVPVKNAAVYMQALVEHKVPVSFHVYPGGFHGFGFHDHFKDADIWKPEFIRWLQRQYN